MISRSQRIFRARQMTAALTLVLTVMLCSSAALAHAKLVRSQPAANASLKEPPKVVELWFSEELEAQFSTIIVTDQNGKRVDKNDVSCAEGNKKLQISLEDLQPGTYMVEWKALSTDQHTMKGKFAFKVEGSAALSTQSAQPQGVVNKPTATLSPQQSAPSSPTESMQESSSSWMQSMVRWLQYLAMMTLFGGFAFYLTVLAPTLGRITTSGEQSNKAINFGERRTLLLSWISVVLILLTFVVAVVQQVSTVFDKTLTEALSPSLLRDISIVRMKNGKWSEPEPLSKDGWEINGCPVSGPAISSSGKNVAVAWFTGAHDQPRVYAALSTDGGATFNPKVLLGDENPIGRVDIIALPSGNAFVSWAERTPGGTEVRARMVRPDRSTAPAIVVAETASGVPHMKMSGDEVVIAWTDSQNSGKVRTAILSMTGN